MPGWRYVVRTFFPTASLSLPDFSSPLLSRAMSKSQEYWRSLGVSASVDPLPLSVTGLPGVSSLSDVLQTVFREYFPLDRYTIVTLVPEAAR